MEFYRKRNKEMRTEQKKDLKTSIVNGIVTTSELLEDTSIQMMMAADKSNEPDFRREYQAAFNKYIGGNWGEAITIFRR